MEAAIAGGVSAAFLSGNAVCGRVLFDDKVRACERVGVFGPPGGTFTATVYPGPKSNVVFNAATIWWADGLRTCLESGTRLS